MTNPQDMSAEELTTAVSERSPDKKIIIYKGNRYYLGTGGYYVSRKHGRLHRKIWEDKNGEIPDGFLVHHIDGDKVNNHIDNLGIMEWGAHTSHHHRGKTEVCVSCAYCVKEFKRNWGATRRYKNVFCSRRCHMLHRNNVLGRKVRLDVSSRKRTSIGTFLPKSP